MSAITPEQSVAEKDGKRKQSKGEQLFDFSVYGVMNWVGTFVITVPIAWWLLHGKGKPLLDKGIHWFEGVMPGVLKVTDKVLSPIRKPPAPELLQERVKWWSRTNAVTFATFQGGNVMLLPIWLAERAKVPFVNAANKALGDTTDPKTIKEAPPVDAWNLIKARLASWGTVLVTFTALGAIVPKTFDKVQDEVGEKLAKLFKGTAYKSAMPERLLVDKAKFEAMKGPVAKAELARVNKLIAPFETIKFQMGKIGSLDLIATTAAVTLLYITSKLFAQQDQKKNKPESRDIAVNMQSQPEQPVALPVPEPAPQPPSATEEPEKKFAERITNARTEQTQNPQAPGVN